VKPLDPRLLRRARATRPFLVTTAGVAVVDTVLLVVQATAVATALARVVEHHATAAAVRGPAAVLLLTTLLRALLHWGDRARAQRAAVLVSGQLRRDLLGRVLDDGRPRPPGGVGVLATRGMDALEPYVTEHLTALVACAVVPVLLLARIAAADPTSAVLLAVTLPLVPLFLALVGRATGTRAEASWTSVRDLAAHLLDVVQGLPTLRLFGRDQAQVETIDQLGEQSRRSVMAGLRAAFLSGVVLELLASLAVALVAVSVGFRLVGGHIGLATAFLVLILTPECFGPLRRVGSSYHAAIDGLTATAEALDILDEPGSPSGTRPLPDGLEVRCDHVGVARHGRPGERPDDASLRVAPGEVVALVGPTGCGKSTLIDVLRGRVTPSTGTTTVGGVPLAELDHAAWTSAIAWVPQRPVLTADTVAANLVLGAPAAGEQEVAEVAASLGIAPLLDRPARTLSAGERQRVALARAVLRVRAGGRLALLDEPSSHLDAATEEAVVATVQQLAALGAAVVVVAHRPALVAIADRVVTVSGGAVEGAADPTSPVEVAPQPAALVTSGTPPPATVAATTGDPGPTADERPLTWLASRTRPLWARFALAVVAAGAATLAGLGLLATSGWLLARASQHPPVLALASVAVVVRALAIGKAVLRYGERLASHDAVLRFGKRVRTELYRNLTRMAPTRLVRLGGGQVLSRLVADLDDVQLLMLRAALPPLVALVAGVAVAVAALLVLPLAGALVAVALVVAGALVPAIGVRLDRRSGATVATERAALAVEVVDLTEAAEELSAYGATGGRLARVEAIDARLQHAQQRSARSAGIADALGLATAGVLATALLLVGATASSGGHLDVLLVPALVLVGLALGEVTGGLPESARRAASLRAVVGRLTEIAPGPTDLTEPVHPVEPPSGPIDVAVRDLVLGWPGDEMPVLDGATFSLAAGSSTVLCGPSGAGKSTLAAALVRFLQPRAGSICLGGTDIESLRGDAVRRLVGWCAQDAHLFATDLAHNLRVAAPEASDEQLWDVLAAVGLGSWARQLPDGLATMVGVRGTEVSGGEAQRLALARVLLADRPVVVLDEPTANLDPDTARDLMRDLLTAAGGRTTLVITHRTEGTEQADHWLWLDDGRVEAGAPPDELLSPGRAARPAPIGHDAPSAAPPPRREHTALR
jgi:ATP-binding cassette subfamily C protein CydCD